MTLGLVVLDLPEVAGDFAGARARVARAGLSPCWIADRGRYRRNGDHFEPALFARVHQIVEQLSGTAVALAPGPLAIEWTVLGRGDYCLIKHEWMRRRQSRAVLDATLDVSPLALAGEAQLVFRPASSGVGGLSHIVEQAPGRLTVADQRGDGWLRYERYLGARVGAGEVWRLRMGFVRRDPAP